MQVMKSSTYNHTPDYYAQTIATGITSLPEVSAAVLTARQKMKDALVEFFDDAIELEKELLVGDPSHCSKDLDRIGNFFADNAMEKFEKFLSPQDPEWTREVLHYIATNIRTAMHLERLEFAKNNPGNIEAHNYKLKFGVN